jgi:hypothetical protein
MVYSLKSHRTACASQSINQSIKSINVLNVLGGNWDPTDKKFSSVNSYRQDLLPTCKHSLRKPPHAFGSHKVINSASFCSSAATLLGPKSSWHGEIIPKSCMHLIDSAAYPCTHALQPYFGKVSIWRWVSRGATATWLTLTTRAAFALSSEQQPAAQMLLLTMLVHNAATEDKCSQEWPMQLNTPSL